MTEPPVAILVIGSALREVCGDQAALGLTFVEEAVTAPRYRLFVVDDAFAALLEDEQGGVAVTGEIVEVDPARWDAIVSSEPGGIAFAPVELGDGRSIPAAVIHAEAVLEKARDITGFGGYAAYRASLSEPL